MKKAKHNGISKFLLYFYMENVAQSEVKVVIFLLNITSHFPQQVILIFYLKSQSTLNQSPKSHLMLDHMVFLLDKNEGRMCFFNKNVAFE